METAKKIPQLEEIGKRLYTIKDYSPPSDITNEGLRQLTRELLKEVEIPASFRQDKGPSSTSDLFSE